MANTSQRSEYTANIIKDLRLNPGVDKIPQEVSPQIVCTYELKPVILAKFQLSTNATQTTMYATGDQDTYLVGVNLSFVKDVTATTTQLDLRGYIEGAQQLLVHFSTTSLTIERDSATMCFPMPGLKIDRSTNLTLNSTTNTGNFVLRCTIYYYVMSK